MIINFIPLWALILSAAIFFYVLLDGYDLGVGMLHIFAPNRSTRNLMMNSISPTWDGNEVWLLLISIGLYAVFPLAFNIIFPALYLPLLIMLFALILRVVAFVFHTRDAAHIHFWDYIFSIGSFVASFTQGIILGAFMQGFAVTGYSFVGSSIDCITPFSIFIGLTAILGYGLLGASWLILKARAEVQIIARRLARWCFILFIIAIASVFVWASLINTHISQLWFSWPDSYYLSPLFMIITALAILEWRSLNSNTTITPFMSTLSLFFMCYLGIVISLLPMAVPYHFTLSQTAASRDTLMIASLSLLPIILLYGAWSCWIFRRKIRS